MDYDLEFGRAHIKKRKISKKMLDSISLKKLKTLAKKYKISCYKKGTRVCVKKSTLLKRLKKSRSINKILESASKIKNKRRTKKTSKKKNHKSRFGLHKIPENYPRLSTPLELSSGKTYSQQLRHYKNIPSTLISKNFQGPACHSNGFSQKGTKPYNFKYTQGSLGRSSLYPYLNINDPNWSKNNTHKFGRYFR